MTEEQRLVHVVQAVTHELNTSPADRTYALIAYCGISFTGLQRPHIPGTSILPTRPFSNNINGAPCPDCKTFYEEYLKRCKAPRMLGYMATHTTTPSYR